MNLVFLLCRLVLHLLYLYTKCFDVLLRSEDVFDICKDLSFGCIGRILSILML